MNKKHVYIYSLILGNYNPRSEKNIGMTRKMSKYDYFTSSQTQ